MQLLNFSRRGICEGSSRLAFLVAPPIKVKEETKAKASYIYSGYEFIGKIIGPRIPASRNAGSPKAPSESSTASRIIAIFLLYRLSSEPRIIASQESSVTTIKWQELRQTGKPIAGPEYCFGKVSADGGDLGLQEKQRENRRRGPIFPAANELRDIRGRCQSNRRD